MSLSKQRIFVAGASGAVGRRMCRLLVDDGYLVYGTTRSPEKAAALRALGVEPFVVDVFDQARLLSIVAEIQSQIVIHQLTDLPPGLDPALMPEARIRNAYIREAGTRNLIAAAVNAGVKRMIVQSIAFVYAPGPLPYTEQSPLNVEAAPSVANMEQQVLEALLEGIILRYGKFYGPGTGFDEPPGGGPVHVDAAADAARRAVTRGARGIYNVAEEDGTVSSRKAIEELGWEPGFRIAL